MLIDYLFMPWITHIIFVNLKASFNKLQFVNKWMKHMTVKTQNEKDYKPNSHVREGIFFNAHQNP